MNGIFLDIESSGLNCYKHRCLEIAVQVIDLYSKKHLGSYSTFVDQPQSVWEASDPESLKVNGLSPENTPNALSEKQISKDIEVLFTACQIQRGKAVFICQNPSFDRPFFSQIISADRQEALNWPYHWLDLASMFWAIRLKEHNHTKVSYPWETGISKNDIAQTLGLEKEKMPHRAMQGVEHLIACYFALFS